MKNNIRPTCINGHRVTKTSHYFYAKRNQFMCKLCKRDSERRAGEHHKRSIEREKQRNHYFGTE